MNLLLIGAGGHARPVAEAAELLGHHIVGYAAPEKSTWCSAPRISDGDPWPQDAAGCIIGIGGTSSASLFHRLRVAKSYAQNGITPIICHPNAIISSRACISEGAVALAGAVVNSGAVVQAYSIINTGAIIEHDVTIGEGAHIAPGAIILGGASVGPAAMVGAGAIILPGAKLAAGANVPALARYR